MKPDYIIVGTHMVKMIQRFNEFITIERIMIFTGGVIIGIIISMVLQ